LHEYAGYRLSKRMLEEFRLLDARAYANVPKSKLYVVNTSSKARLSVQGVPQEVVRFACNWDTDLSNVMTATSVLERLTTCLTVS
jgi:hypothetical protein